MERVACAMQFIGHIERWLMPLARGDIVGDDLQMHLSLFRENIVQDRVHFQRQFFFGWLVARCSGNREDRRIRIALCECICTSNQQTDIGLGLGTDLKLLDQFRHRVSSLLYKINHRRRTHQRSIDQSIEEILNCPAIFTDAFCTDHATAAFECVKRSPYRDQHFQIVGRLQPGWEVPLDTGDFLFRFLNKYFEQFRIQVLCILGYDRQRHDLSGLQLRYSNDQCLFVQLYRCVCRDFIL